MNNYTIIIPFLIVIIVKRLSGKSSLAMFAGTATCLLLGFFGNINDPFSVFNLSLIKNYIMNVIISNLPIYASIYTIGLFMFIIEHSKAIRNTQSNLSRCRVSKRAIGLIPTLISLIFSVDDYLSVSTSGFMSWHVIGNTKDIKKKTAVIVSLLAVSFCFINPMSSWHPVIIRSFENAGINAGLFTSTIPYNFAVIAMILSAIILSKMLRKNIIRKNMRKLHISLAEALSANGPRELMLSMLVLVIAFIMASKLFTPDCTLLVSSSICDIFMIVLFIKNGLINVDNIKTAIKKTNVINKKNPVTAFLTEMTDIVIMLFSIWTFVFTMSNIMNLSGTITALLEEAEVSSSMIPALIFILAMSFSFMTGSAYGSFGLFITIAKDLSMGNNLVIALSAALSGSLFSVFSLASGVTILAASSTKLNADEVRNEQKIFGILTAVFSTLGYILLGNTNGISHASIAIVIIISVLYYITAKLSVSILSKRKENSNNNRAEESHSTGINIARQGESWENRHMLKCSVTHMLLSAENYFHNGWKGIHRGFTKAWTNKCRFA